VGPDHGTATDPGDGSQTRSLCYVDDMVDGLVALLRSEHHGPMNLGNPEEVSISELADLVEKTVGVDVGRDYLPRPVDDPQVRCPDTTLAQEVLGWQPRVSLVEGLRLTLPWFQAAIGLDE
jgi:dTDP-glucose 4,6-dehydratase